VQGSGEGSGVPQRILRGRNERVWAEDAPETLQRIVRVRDPTAAQVNSPWTLSLDCNGAPRKLSLSSSRSAAVPGLPLICEWSMWSVDVMGCD
jgi:hypothetical protein